MQKNQNDNTQTQFHIFHTGKTGRHKEKVIPFIIRNC